MSTTMETIQRKHRYQDFDKIKGEFSYQTFQIFNNNPAKYLL